MDIDPVKPTTSGPAFRVTIIGQQMAESYENVYVVLDPKGGMVHLLSADGQIHYLTIPQGSTLIEWADPSVLAPHPRVPPFGPGSFKRIQEGIGRMAEGLGSPT